MKILCLDSTAKVATAAILSDGAVLSFSRLDDGSWTSLSVKSIDVEGAVTVVLTAEDEKGLGGTETRLVAMENPPASLDGWTIDWHGKYEASLSIRNDGVWVNFAKPGFVLIVE